MSHEKASSQHGPLVSIGVPVRNGGALLVDALQQLIDQTYPNLEILISDNCSTDDTPDICRSFIEQDSRVRYHRQEKPIKSIENFRYVFENTRGDYFMWAAYDDRHTLNYIEVLLQAALQHPGCSLVFSEVVDFSQHDPFNGVKLDYSFASDDATPFFTKLRRTWKISPETGQPRTGKSEQTVRKVTRVRWCLGHHRDPAGTLGDDY